MQCDFCSEHSGIEVSLKSLNKRMERIENKQDWLISLMITYMVGIPIVLGVLL